MFSFDLIHLPCVWGATSGMALDIGNPWGKAHVPLNPSTTLRMMGILNNRVSNASKSLKDVLSSNVVPPQTSSHIVHSTFNGLPTIFLHGEEIEKLAKSLPFSLVGKFTTRHLNMDRIRDFFHSLKLCEPFSVGLIDARHVLINFENDMNYTCVFACCFYCVFNCQMRLLKLSPFLCEWRISYSTCLDFIA